jgi:hypothetical protein
MPRVRVATLVPELAELEALDLDGRRMNREPKGARDADRHAAGQRRDEVTASNDVGGDQEVRGCVLRPAL